MHYLYSNHGGRLCPPIKLVPCVFRELLVALWHRAQPDWAYEFPDRTGQGTQIFGTGIAGPDLIRTYIFNILPNKYCNMFTGSKPPKFCGSPIISLNKYQPSVFLCLLFAEKINSLLVNQQKKSELKLVLRSWKKSKQNLVKKIFGDHQIFWWFGSREHVISYQFSYDRSMDTNLVSKKSKLGCIWR